jgi:hypothetical protein
MPDTISTIERISDKLAQGIVDNVLVPDETNLTLPVFGPRSTKQLGKNRISVSASAFQQASDQMALNPNGVYFYNHRRGRVTFEIVTQRQGESEVGPSSKHGLAVGRIRWLMSRVSQKLVAANVGGYEIYVVDDLGDTWTRNNETATDRTALSFAVELCIPNTNYTDS